MTPGRDRRTPPPDRWLDEVELVAEDRLYDCTCHWYATPGGPRAAISTLSSPAVYARLREWLA